MSDVEFDDVRDPGDTFSGPEIEAVTGMNFQAKTMSQAACRDDAPPFRLGIPLTPCRHGLTPGTRMDLDAWGPDGGGGVDLCGFSGNEQRHPNAGFGEFADERLDPAYLAGGVKAALGGPFRAALRHQTRRVWLGFKRDPKHLIRRGHFQVEGRGDLSLEPGDIVVADVTAILAKVGRNAVGAGCHRQVGGAHWVRVVAATGISQRRNMVNIDAQSQVGNVCHGVLPKLSGVPNRTHPLDHAPRRSVLAVHAPGIGDDVLGP
jgi:hypothetical protein